MVAQNAPARLTDRTEWNVNAHENELWTQNEKTPTDPAARYMKVINFPEHTQDSSAHNQRLMVNTLCTSGCVDHGVCTVLVGITVEPCPIREKKKSNWISHRATERAQQTAGREVNWSNAYSGGPESSVEKIDGMAVRGQANTAKQRSNSDCAHTKKSDSIRDSCRDKRAFTDRLEIAGVPRTLRRK